MSDSIDVVRIIRRSTQGVTLPFLCEGSDGLLYWAKGDVAGERALCCEWIAGRLAQQLELPIPPFIQLNVPEELISQSFVESVSDLGAGIVFGSQHIDDAQEIGFEDANSFMRNQPEMANKILIFDWWIQNGDRTLGEKGGNPNILISVENSGMHIIDHNLAFDRSWKVAEFFNDHVFTRQRNAVNSECFLAIRDKMRQVYKEVESIWLQIPEEWKYLDSEMSMPLDFTLEEIYRTLNRLETEWDREWK